MIEGEGGGPHMAIDFDFSREGLTLNRPATMAEVEDVERSLGVTLPVSYKSFVTQVSNGFWAEIGNALGLFRLSPGPNGEEAGFTLLDATAAYTEDKWIEPGVPLLPFAKDGVGNAWAFYTAVHSKGDEYPVVLIIPNSPEQYVLVHSSFDSFLDFNLNLLARVEAEQDDWDDEEEGTLALWYDLYRRFDPAITPPPPFDPYEGATDADGLREAIERQGRAGWQRRRRWPRLPWQRP